MREDRIWVLIARKMTNEASGEELLELENLEKIDYKVAWYIEVFSKCWKQEMTEEREGTQLAFEKIVRKINEESR